MPLPLRTSVPGAMLSPNFGLTRLEPDAADSAAAAFGDRLALRVDPRDIRRSPANPTGRRKVHYMAPNRDPAIFTGTGVSVATIPGLYNGQEVFSFTNTGTAGAGTHNDLAIGPKSLNGVTEFSVFGVAHLDPAIYGVTGLKPLIGLYRDNAFLESCVAHQFTGGINYLSIFADQQSGGGENVNLDTASPVTAGVPFFYLFRVFGSGDASTVNIRINSTTTNSASGSNKNTPEGGSTHLFIGHHTADGNQLRGGHARAYIVSGNALDTTENQALAASLMAEMKNLHGIA